MIRVRPLLVATAALCVSVVAATAADARRPCASRGSRTVLATAGTRIFTRPARVAPRYRVTRWYGCAYGTDRRFRLATVGEPGIFVTAVRPVRLVGHLVAYSDYYEGPAGGTLADVRVRDLRSGRQVVSQQAGTPDAEERQRPVEDLELKADGAVAWIEASEPVSPPPAGAVMYRVRKRDAGGAAVTLDEGPDIAPRSLAVSASTVYWTRGGSPRSAALN